MNILNELEKTAEVYNDHGDYIIRCEIGGTVVMQRDFDNEFVAAKALHFAKKVAAAANFSGVGRTNAQQRDRLINAMNSLS